MVKEPLLKNVLNKIFSFIIRLKYNVESPRTLWKCTDLPKFENVDHIFSLFFQLSSTEVFVKLRAAVTKTASLR